MLFNVNAFFKKATKDGGKYEVIEDNVKKIDEVYQIIYLNSFKINISNILTIDLLDE